MKTRFTFFSVLAVLFTTALAPVDVARAVTIIKGPYLQQVAQRSIVIMWETDDDSGSRVDYGSGSDYVEDTELVTIHEIELATNLNPGSTYDYTVTSTVPPSDSASATSTFTTAPAGDQYFSFVAYGDTRSNPKEHALVVQAIMNSDPDSKPDIVIHTGDLVQDGNDPSHWGPQFFTPARELMKNTPMFPVLGNHEYSSGETLFFDFFSLPDKELGNEQWYAFTYGCVQFIALDTTATYSEGSTQYLWLEKELIASADATWLIVYFHHPPYTRTDTHSDNPAVIDNLVPLFELYNVDMVFSGHSHAYERYFNKGVYYIVTGGGGAPLHRPLKDKKIPIRQAGEKEYHYCVIDVDSESLTLSARDNSGDEFDTIEITKGVQPTLDMHVYAIEMNSKVAGPNRSGIATIWIKDTSDTNNVEGATVYGKWSGLVEGAASGRTGVDGKVTLQSSKIKIGGTFTFTVDNVEKTDWNYVAGEPPPSGSIVVTVP